MDEKECVAELLETLKQLDDNVEQAMERYKRRVFVFIRNISPKAFDSLHFEKEIQRVAAYPVILGALFLKGEFREVDEIANESLAPYLIGGRRAYDYFIGLTIRFLYLARKNEGLDSSALFSLLVTNKELGNEYTVSVATNCLLDMLISNKIFQRIESPISTVSEQARYNYHNGVISMVEGDYEPALRYFHESIILSTNRNLVFAAERCIILCMLLTSDYNIPYLYKRKLKPYFELVFAVKRAELRRFEEVLETNKEEFMSQGLYFVARRLSQNVIQEGIRRISLVYSRISYGDIACLLKIHPDEVEYLVKRTIKKGLIRGKVVDGVFHSLRENRSAGDIGISIRNCIHLTKYIQEHMMYPAIEPLCYERVNGVQEK